MPYRIRLISLTCEDTQDGSNASVPQGTPAGTNLSPLTSSPSWPGGGVPDNMFAPTHISPLLGDHIRLRLFLDGRVALNRDQRGFRNGSVWDLASLTDHPDVKEPFYVSAEVSIKEIDTNAAVVFDTDTDELFDPTSLYLVHAPDDIGDAERFVVLAGHGGRYRLRYRIEQTKPWDAASEWTQLRASYSGLPQETGLPSSMLARDKGNCRWICSIDGGGMRGMVALRVLEQLESYYGAGCIEIFDMFAGSSTGAIIAAMLATGYPVREIISLYRSERARQMIFSPNFEHQRQALNHTRLVGSDFVETAVDIVEETPRVGRLVTQLRDTLAERIITPRYRKELLRRLLVSAFSKVENGTRTFLTMADGVIPPKATPSFPSLTHPLGLRQPTRRDLLITAHDVSRRETIYFSAFHHLVARRGSPGMAHVVRGAYRDVRIADAVEASTAAPTYFASLERFTDGGIGSYNNPAFAAAAEAMYFSGDDPYQPEGSVLPPKYTPYRVDSVTGMPSGTVVFSFGTGTVRRKVDDWRAPAGLVSASERTDHAGYWVEQIIESGFQSAAQQQNFLCRELLKDRLKYHRFNIVFNEETLTALGVDAIRTPAGELLDAERMLARIRLDAVDAVDFAVIDSTAIAFARGLRLRSFLLDQGGVELEGDSWVRPPAEERRLRVREYADDVKAALRQRY